MLIPYTIGIFVSSYIHLFGQHGFICHEMKDALGRFNDNMYNKVLCFLDEAICPSSKKEISRLKTAVTEDKQRIEPKYEGVKVVDNFVDYISSTNDIHTVPAGNNSRRYFCLDVDNRYSIDQEAGRVYFDKLLHAIEDDDYAGLKAWQALLMEVELGNFDKVYISPHIHPFQ